jgi:hypothetical protein
VRLPKDSGARKGASAFRNRPFDSIPKGKLARLTNIIARGYEGGGGELGLAAWEQELWRSLGTLFPPLPFLLRKRGAEEEGICNKGINVRPIAQADVIISR